MVCLNKRWTLELFCFKRVAKSLSIAVNIFLIITDKIQFISLFNP